MLSSLQNRRTWILFLLVFVHFASVVRTEDTCSSTQDGICSSSDNNNNNETTCKDNRPASNECPYWAKNGECEKNPTYMTVECRKSCGICVDTGVLQIREGPAYRVTSDDTMKRLEKIETYLRSSVKPELREICKNEHEMCTVWVSSFHLLK